MPTKSKLRTTIELNPGDKERLQQIALSLGIVQTTGTDAGKIGSISHLMQNIATGEIQAIPGKVSQSEVVDEAIVAARLLKELAMLIDTGMIVRGSIAGDAIIDRIETWKEQSQ